MRRVVVIGTSGSGKTTLARRLAQRLNVPHIELDALHWQANWTSTPQDQLVEKVRVALDAADASAGGWTVCGQYGKVRELAWARADTIAWLDYPMTVVFTRVLRRTLMRCWRAEELWNGNRESLRLQFFDRDSLFLWVINSWRKNRRQTPKRLRDPRCAHLRVLRFRTPAELERWLGREAMSPDVPKCPKIHDRLNNAAQLRPA